MNQQASRSSLPVPAGEGCEAFPVNSSWHHSYLCLTLSYKLQTYQHVPSSEPDVWYRLFNLKTFLESWVTCDAWYQIRVTWFPWAMGKNTPTSTLIILDLKSPLFISYSKKMKKLKRQTGQSIPPRVEIAECNLPSNSWITAVCRAASTSGAPKIACTSTWATHLAPPSRTWSDGVRSHPMVRCHACH